MLQHGVVAFTPPARFCKTFRILQRHMFSKPDERMQPMCEIVFVSKGLNTISPCYTWLRAASAAVVETRWLHVRGRGYKHGCIPNQDGTVTDTHLANVLSSTAFADDLLCPTSTIQDLQVQARKLTPTQTGKHLSSLAATTATFCKVVLEKIKMG
eukprot:1140559-Pelagomonas_calceolata.AAC.1